MQDKLWLPGLLKLNRLIDQGFFGRILSVRGEFGYWVFTGEDLTPQRPSWNYRQEDGGEYDNAFKIQWELFLRHLAKDEPFPWTLLAGAKGVQLAEVAMDSWQRRAWVNVPEL